MRLSLSSQDNQAIDRSIFEQAKDEFYELRGFDPETGWPTRETLNRLDLADIADKMYPGIHEL